MIIEVVSEDENICSAEIKMNLKSNQIVKVDEINL